MAKATVFPISREMVSKSPPNIEVYGIGFTAHFLECDDGWFQRYCTFLSICGDGNAKAQSKKTSCELARLAVQLLYTDSISESSESSECRVLSMDV